MSNQPSTYEVTVAEAVTECLLREGIDTVFGIPSSHNLTLLDAFRRAGIRSYEGRHEGAAACMAAGYAQASGKVGVVYVQTGPGATNAVTGIAAAYMDSIPMLLLPAQIARNDFGRDGHQEATGLTKCFDQLEMFRGMSHYTARPSTPENAVRMFRTALRSAIRCRGPAVLELPADLAGQKVTFRDLEQHEYRAASTVVDVQGVERVAELLRSSRRPAIIVGDRLTHVGATQDVLALCEEQQIACIIVNYAKGIIPEDHELFGGIVNQTGHVSASEYLRAADLVIALGVRFNLATTSKYQESLFPNLVQIDNDEREIGRIFPVKLGVTGDLLATVRALRVAAGKRSAARETASILTELKKKHHTYDDPEGHVDTDPLTPTRALRVIRDHVPRDVMVVGDTGTVQVSLSRHFPIYSPDGYFALYAMAPMGSGLPMALGVQIANPAATVLSIIGDGGFLTHAGELSVAAQHDLPVITIVINNGTYKSIADRQEMFFGKTYAVDIKSPSHEKLAESFDCDGYTARTSGELASAVERAVSRRRPAVIEVPVDPNHKNVFDPEVVKAYKAVWSGHAESWPFPPIKR